MRFAFVPLLVVVAAGCGAAQPDRRSAAPSPSRPVRSVQLSPSAADGTRAQWYEAVKRSAAVDGQPALSESDVVRGVREGAATLDASVVGMHYLPLLGGAAEVIVEPEEPVAFAERPRGTTTLLGPLGRNGHAYLMTVVDSTGAPLFVLGWVPGIGREIGEGIAWQAPGIASDAIYGRPATVG